MDATATQSSNLSHSAQKKPNKQQRTTTDILTWPEKKKKKPAFSENTLLESVVLFLMVSRPPLYHPTTPPGDVTCISAYVIQLSAEQTTQLSYKSTVKKKKYNTVLRRN
jgi:hypothetical protein